MRQALGPWLRGFPVNRLRQEMDRVFNEVFTPAARELGPFPGGFAGEAGPRLNVWEEDDVFFAEDEVPGLRHEDLDLSVVGNQLSIKGKRETATARGTDRFTS